MICHLLLIMNRARYYPSIGPEMQVKWHLWSSIICKHVSQSISRDVHASVNPNQMDCLVYTRWGAFTSLTEKLTYKPLLIYQNQVFSLSTASVDISPYSTLIKKRHRNSPESDVISCTKAKFSNTRTAALREKSFGMRSNTEDSVGFFRKAVPVWMRKFFF